MVFRIAGYTASVILLLLFFILLISAITGKTPRAYSVLDHNTKVASGSEQITIGEFAGRYQPLVKRDPNLPTPPLLQVKYEVIEQPDFYAINYYHVWEDEIHPNLAIHFLYRLFRAAYCGYPVRDIEYLQLNVSKVDGKVEKIRFETSPGEDYFVVASVHLVDQYFLRPDGMYNRLLSKRDGSEISRSEKIHFDFSGSHPVVGVATWNHLTRRILPGDTTFNQMLHADLIPLSAEEYQSDKYVRKSQGDFQTQENPFWRALGVVATVLYFILSGLGLVTLIAQWSRKPRR